MHLFDAPVPIQSKLLIDDGDIFMTKQKSINEICSLTVD